MGAGGFTGRGGRRKGEWEDRAAAARGAAGLAPEGERAVTKAELAKHNTRESLWVALHGQVYDLTKTGFLGRHPGGQTILLGSGGQVSSPETVLRPPSLPAPATPPAHPPSGLALLSCVQMTARCATGRGKAGG